jgi:hypothetical protein
MFKAAYICVLYACFAVIYCCSNGCTCRRGIAECLDEDAPAIPVFGYRAFTLNTLHFTPKQALWVKRNVCKSRYARLTHIYLHTEDGRCNPTKLKCKKTVTCYRRSELEVAYSVYTGQGVKAITIPTGLTIRGVNDKTLPNTADIDITNETPRSANDYTYDETVTISVTETVVIGDIVTPTVTHIDEIVTTSGTDIDEIVTTGVTNIGEIVKTSGTDIAIIVETTEPINPNSVHKEDLHETTNAMDTYITQSTVINNYDIDADNVTDVSVTLMNNKAGAGETFKSVDLNIDVTITTEYNKYETSVADIFHNVPTSDTGGDNSSPTTTTRTVLYHNNETLSQLWYKWTKAEILHTTSGTFNVKTSNHNDTNHTTLEISTTQQPYLS